MSFFSIEPNLKSRKFSGKTRMIFEKSIHNLTDSHYLSNYLRSTRKNIEATIYLFGWLSLSFSLSLSIYLSICFSIYLFIDFYKTYDSIHRETM